MPGRALLSYSALAAAFLVLAPGPARAASWLELNFYLPGPRYDGVLPACDAPAALGTIAHRFQQKEYRFWNTNLKILDFHKIRETDFRPWAANSIPRRYCSGLVEVSDGSKHAIHYSIIEANGVIGESWGVEWCVTGLDRNWAYNPACKMARP